MAHQSDHIDHHTPGYRGSIVQIRPHNRSDSHVSSALSCAHSHTSASPYSCASRITFNASSTCSQTKTVSERRSETECAWRTGYTSCHVLSRLHRSSSSSSLDPPTHRVPLDVLQQHLHDVFPLVVVIIVQKHLVYRRTPPTATRLWLARRGAWPIEDVRSPTGSRRPSLYQRARHQTDRSVYPGCAGGENGGDEARNMNTSGPEFESCANAPTPARTHGAHTLTMRCSLFCDESVTNR